VAVAATCKGEGDVEGPRRSGEAAAAVLRRVVIGATLLACSPHGHGDGGGATTEDGLNARLHKARASEHELYLRKKIVQRWERCILANIIKDLNLISNNLKVVKVIVSDVDIAEVTILDEWNNLNHFYFIFALFFAF
jgi:hypothetical protein